MEWETVALLAVVVLAEGMDRVTPDSVIVRQTFGGSWRVVHPLSVWREWHLVSWLPAICVCVVLRTDGPESEGQSQLASASNNREEGLGPALSLLRFMCGLEAAVLIFGVPWCTARFGASGLLGGIFTAVFLSFEITLVSALALETPHVSFRSALRSCRSLLSPFAAPRAADLVLSTAWSARPRRSVLRSILSHEEMTSAMRPWLYDTARGTVDDESERWKAELGSLLSSEDRERITSQPPGCGIESNYCPRCGTLFLVSSLECSACDVPLVITQARTDQTASD